MAINLGSGYPLAAGSVARATLNSILAAIVSKFSGGIDNSDINADADIVPTKLSASNMEWTAYLLYHFGMQGAWPATGATTPLVAVPMPGQSGDTSWVATDVSYVCSDVGTADASFDVRYGAYDGTGAWVNSGSILTGQTIASPGADNTGSQGRSTRLAESIPNSATVQSIALMSAGQGTGVISQGFLAVSVRLRRVLQSI